MEFDYRDYPRAKGCNRPNFTESFGCMFCEWSGKPGWLPVWDDDCNKIEYFMPYCPECVRRKDNWNEVIRPVAKAKELYEQGKRSNAALGRKRAHEERARIAAETCPHCKGTGRIPRPV